MFAIEEVRGVTGIKRKPLETRKRFETTRRPLPPVAQQVDNTERALAFSERTDGRWIPAAKIEIAFAGLRRRTAPGEFPLRRIFRSIRRPMPLRLGGQRLPRPASICVRFRVADVHWPIERQRNFIEHRSVVPLVANPAPKRGMTNAICSSPIPILFRPPGRILVASHINEIEEFTVRHFIFVDLECWHIDAL